jgi:hypothetical protein
VHRPRTSPAQEFIPEAAAAEPRVEAEAVDFVVAGLRAAVDPAEVRAVVVLRVATVEGDFPPEVAREQE